MLFNRLSDSDKPTITVTDRKGRSLAPIEIIDSITHRRIDGGTPKHEDGIRDPVWRTTKRHRTEPRHLLVIAYGQPCRLIRRPGAYRGNGGYRIDGPHAVGQLVQKGSTWAATIYAHPPHPSEAPAEQLALFEGAL